MVEPHCDSSYNVSQKLCVNYVQYNKQPNDYCYNNVPSTQTVNDIIANRDNV